MPRHNRVTPYGNIIATPARGTLMGNRGILHDAEGRLPRPYAYRGKRWIYCALSFKGRQRQVMSPGRYTELFFLDEATALAAGHRPCAECLRPRFLEFRAAWAEANPELAGESSPAVAVIDAALHQERLVSPYRPRKQTYLEQLTALPAGVFIALEPEGIPHLVLERHLLPWQPAGYDPPIPRPVEQTVQVLTPPSIVRAIALGFEPQVYPSA